MSSLLKLFRRSSKSRRADKRSDNADNAASEIEAVESRSRECQRRQPKRLASLRRSLSRLGSFRKPAAATAAAASAAAAKGDGHSTRDLEQQHQELQIHEQQTPTLEILEDVKEAKAESAKTKKFRIGIKARATPELVEVEPSVATDGSSGNSSLRLEVEKKKFKTPFFLRRFPSHRKKRAPAPAPAPAPATPVALATLATEAATAAATRQAKTATPAADEACRLTDSKDNGPEAVLTDDPSATMNATPKVVSPVDEFQLLQVRHAQENQSQSLGGVCDEGGGAIVTGWLPRPPKPLPSASCRVPLLPALPPPLPPHRLMEVLGQPPFIAASVVPFPQPSPSPDPTSETTKHSSFEVACKARSKHPAKTAALGDLPASGESGASDRVNCCRSGCQRSMLSVNSATAESQSSFEEETIVALKATPSAVHRIENVEDSEESILAGGLSRMLVSAIDAGEVPPEAESFFETTLLPTAELLQKVDPEIVDLAECIEKASCCVKMKCESLDSDAGDSLAKMERHICHNYDQLESDCAKRCVSHDQPRHWDFIEETSAWRDETNGFEEFLPPSLEAESLSLAAVAAAFAAAAAATRTLTLDMLTMTESDGAVAKETEAQLESTVFPAEPSRMAIFADTDVCGGCETPIQQLEEGEITIEEFQLPSIADKTADLVDDAEDAKDRGSEVTDAVTNLELSSDEESNLLGALMQSNLDSTPEATDPDFQESAVEPSLSLAATNETTCLDAVMMQTDEALSFEAVSESVEIAAGLQAELSLTLATQSGGDGPFRNGAADSEDQMASEFDADLLVPTLRRDYLLSATGDFQPEREYQQQQQLRLSSSSSSLTSASLSSLASVSPAVTDEEESLEEAKLIEVASDVAGPREAEAEAGKAERSQASSESSESSSGSSSGSSSEEATTQSLATQLVCVVEEFETAAIEDHPDESAGDIADAAATEIIKSSTGYTEPAKFTEQDDEDESMTLTSKAASVEGVDTIRTLLVSFHAFDGATGPDNSRPTSLNPHLCFAEDAGAPTATDQTPQQVHSTAPMECENENCLVASGVRVEDPPQLVKARPSACGLKFAEGIVVGPLN